MLQYPQCVEMLTQALPVSAQCFFKSEVSFPVFFYHVSASVLCIVPSYIRGKEIKSWQNSNLGEALEHFH